ncbi:MAG: hypothetical protein A2W35_11535 [Chloroflexi bacterium RBG_16_57_11]|nr:MAG: hypothetical protein A2W35_11535 [Chloroflexi bacterium RBG_16_57_11]
MWNPAPAEPGQTLARDEMDASDAAPEDLPLPDPFPDYLACPHCGEPEVEVWCYQTRAQCHRCGGWFDHAPHDHCKIGPACQVRPQNSNIKFILLPLVEQDPDHPS